MRNIIILMLVTCLVATISCTKYKPATPIYSDTVELLGVDSTELKTYLKGNWNIFYRRQMFDSTIMQVLNSKMSFNSNVDSIKWIDNNTTKVNSKIIYRLDQSPIVTNDSAQTINFSNSSQSFSWVANDYYKPEKRLTLIDKFTRTIYYLYKY